jgi:hypothetical protein
MVDGFHWTRVTSKQLRFIYEAITLLPAPPHMYELAARIDGDASATGGAASNAAVRNSHPASRIDGSKEQT